MSSDLDTLNMLILTKVAQIKAQRMEIDSINREFHQLLAKFNNHKEELLEKVQNVGNSSLASICETFVQSYEKLKASERASSRASYHLSDKVMKNVLSLLNTQS